MISRRSAIARLIALLLVSCLFADGRTFPPPADTAPLALSVDQNHQAILPPSVISPQSPLAAKPEAYSFRQCMALVTEGMVAGAVIAWPTRLLLYLTPRQWAVVFLYAGEFVLAGLLVWMVVKLRAHYLALNEPDLPDPSRRALMSTTLTAAATGAGMALWPFIVGHPTHEKERELLIAVLRQPYLETFAKPPDFPDARELAEAHQRMTTIVTYGDVRVEKYPEGNGEIFSVQNGKKLRLSIYSLTFAELKQLLAWGPEVLLHEIFHLCQRQIDAGAESFLAIMGLETRVKPLIKIADLRRLTILLKRPVWLADLYRAGLWTAEVFEKDPAFERYSWTILNRDLTSEIQAYWGEMAILYARKPSHQTLVQFTTARFREVLQNKSLTFPQWLRWAGQHPDKVPIIEWTAASELWFAPFFDPRGITPSFEKGVLDHLFAAGQQEEYWTPYIQAKRDRRFRASRLKHGWGRRAPYDEALLEWFRQEVLHGSPPRAEGIAPMQNFPRELRNERQA